MTKGTAIGECLEWLPDEQQITGSVCLGVPKQDLPLICSSVSLHLPPQTKYSVGKGHKVQCSKYILLYLWGHMAPTNCQPEFHTHTVN